MINKHLFYSIRKQDGVYLQGIKENDNKPKSGVAPTMGTRYTYNDFDTVWGHKEQFFEPLTAASYIKTLFEEFRWETKSPFPIAILPKYMTIKEWEETAK